MYIGLPILTNTNVKTIGMGTTTIARKRSIRLGLIILPSCDRDDIGIFTGKGRLSTALSLETSSRAGALFCALSNLSRSISIRISKLGRGRCIISLRRRSNKVIETDRINVMGRKAVIALRTTPSEKGVFMG